MSVPVRLCVCVCVYERASAFVCLCVSAHVCVHTRVFVSCIWGGCAFMMCVRMLVCLYDLRERISGQLICVCIVCVVYKSIHA